MIKSKSFIISFVIILVITLIGLFAYISQQYNKKNIANDIYSECSKSKEYGKCYEDRLRRLTLAQPLPIVIETLSLLKERDSRLNNCHLLAHQISRTELLKDPLQWDTLLSKVPAAECGGGFVHGILEEYIGQNPDTQIDSSLIKTTCEQRVRSVLDYSNCVHSLGHLVLLQLGYDLKKATAVCLDIPLDLNQDTCLSGVFMENTTRINGIEHGYPDYRIFKKVDEVKKYHDFCISLRGNAAEACWIEYARVNLIFYSGDIEKTLAECDTLDNFYSKGCQLFTINLSMDVSTTAPVQIISLCDRYRDMPDMFNDCRITTLSVIAFNSPKLIPAIVDYCNKVEDTFKSACFKQVGTILPFFEHSDRTGLCRDAEHGYMSSCTFEGEYKI